MKYKYPKKIIIGDTEFKIKYDKNGEGADFSFANKGKSAFVRFGMANHAVNKLEFLSHIIHEFKEIIQCEQDARFYGRGNDIYIFHYDHAQHDDLCSRLAGIIKEFIV